MSNPKKKTPLHHEAKWNEETQSGTYDDKIHHGEVRLPTKKLTPLQEAIERIENGDPKFCTPAEVVSILESLLPKEEEYTMDAFLAGGDAMQKIKEGKPYTDFINYFKQYKP